MEDGAKATLNYRSLIERVRMGEKECFSELVNAHKDEILSLVMREVGDHTLAHDLTQEVFIRAYRHLGTFRFESQFSTWLVRIALNVTNSYFSSRGYRERLKTVPIVDQPNAYVWGSEEQTDEAALSALRYAIRGLSARYRDAIILVALEQKTYAEAATILGIPVGTVRSRLNQARFLLRKKISSVLKQEEDQSPTEAKETTGKEFIKEVS